MEGAEHGAVCDGNCVASDKLRLSLCELFLECCEERSPLICDKVSVERVLLRRRIEGEIDSCGLSEKVSPRVNDPINLDSLAPVTRVVVSLLGTNGSQDSVELLHALASIVNEWQLAHFTCIASTLAHHPAGKANILLVPLSVAMVEHGTEWLWSAMTREVFDTDSLWGYSFSRASVSH